MVFLLFLFLVHFVISQLKFFVHVYSYQIALVFVSALTICQNHTCYIPRLFMIVPEMQVLLQFPLNHFNVPDLEKKIVHRV